MRVTFQVLLSHSQSCMNLKPQATYIHAIQQCNNEYHTYCNLNRTDSIVIMLSNTYIWLFSFEDNKSDVLTLYPPSTHVFNNDQTVTYLQQKEIN